MFLLFKDNFPLHISIVPGVGGSSAEINTVQSLTFGYTKPKSFRIKARQPHTCTQKQIYIIF